MKKTQVIHRLSIILFTVCLVLSAIIFPALVISTRNQYYVNQLEKCGLYPEDGQTITVKYIGGISGKNAQFTNKQIDEVIEHITDFLNGKKTSFSLQMNGVLINGQPQDNVDIFCETSIKHMDDVRELFETVKAIAVFIVLILILSGVWMLTHKKGVRDLIFKYSLFTVLGILACAFIFILIVFIKTCASGFSLDSFSSTLWEYLHYVFFPFDQDKFNGSFFSDPLTMLLTLDFFINTVITVLINVLAFVTAWLFSAKLISKKHR